MTKRRHPAPIGQRRPGVGQGRRRPRPRDIPAPPSGPVDYFTERRALFWFAKERAVELSKLVAGQIVDEQRGWAQWNHLRMCITGSTLLTLAGFQARIDAGEECTLDQGSISALSRGMAESAAMVAYLVDPTLTAEQWDLRKHVLWLHDATTRYKMFSKLDNEEQATAFRADMQDLRTRIEAFPEFQALAPERQGKVIAGSEIYLHGLRSAVRLAGWDVDEFDSMYGYLSSYTHSSPVSFIRLAEHGVDFKVPTEAQRRIAGNALEGRGGFRRRSAAWARPPGSAGPLRRCSGAGSMTSVYVIASEAGPLKVGIAGNPRRRLSTLRTASAVRLGMVYSAKISGDAKAVERRAHELLTSGRLSGEWFDVPQNQAVAAIALAATELGCGLEPEGAANPLPAILTSAQLRAARALVRWDQSKVAEAAAVSIETVKRLEKMEGPLGSVRVNTIDAIQRALEAAGVIFIAENGEGPGVRLRKVGPKDGGA